MSVIPIILVYILGTFVLLERNTDVKRKDREGLPRPAYFMLSQPTPSVVYVFTHAGRKKHIFYDIAKLQQVEGIPAHKSPPRIADNSAASPVGRVANVLVLFQLIADHLQELVGVGTQVLHQVHQVLDGLLHDHRALETKVRTPLTERGEEKKKNPTKTKTQTKQET